MEVIYRRSCGEIWEVSPRPAEDNFRTKPTHLPEAAAGEATEGALREGGRKDEPEAAVPCEIMSDDRYARAVCPRV